MRFTKRNHYNPCFWTALWNPAYYSAFVLGTPLPGEARMQVVSALSVKSGRIRRTSVDRAHYDKGLGVAEITREAAEEFARRCHPDEYEQFLEDNASAEYPVYLDFEEFLSGLEAMRPYEVLLDVARSASVDTVLDKTDLALFVLLQNVRSHSMLNAAVQWHEENERQKFEAFVTLKWFLQDPRVLARIIAPMMTSRWTLYVADSDAFPLCDSPILINRQSTLVALSPRLLLQLQPHIRESPEAMPRRRRVKDSKLEELRRRTIGNTFREIIFSDSVRLASWQRSLEFAHRTALMRDAKRYNRLVASRPDGELWHVNAFSNLG